MSATEYQKYFRSPEFRSGADFGKRKFQGTIVFGLFGLLLLMYSVLFFSRPEALAVLLIAILVFLFCAIYLFSRGFRIVVDGGSAHDVFMEESSKIVDYWVNQGIRDDVDKICTERVQLWGELNGLYMFAVAPLDVSYDEYDPSAVCQYCVAHMARMRRKNPIPGYEDMYWIPLHLELSGSLTDIEGQLIDLNQKIVIGLRKVKEYTDPAMIEPLALFVHRRAQKNRNLAYKLGKFIRLITFRLY